MDVGSLDAGLLRERATFQAEVRTPDGGGGAAMAWQDVTTVWARYLPASAREAVAAGRLEAAEAGVLTVRASTATRAITSSHRVVMGGEIYAIKGGPTDFDRDRAMLDFRIEKGVAT